MAILRDWPRPLREMLRHMLPEKVENAAALRFVLGSAAGPGPKRMLDQTRVTGPLDC